MRTTAEDWKDERRYDGFDNERLCGRLLFKIITTQRDKFETVFMEADFLQL